MNIQIMSKNQAVAASSDILENTIIISIRNTNEKKTVFTKNPYIKDILYLEFDDVDADKDGLRSISIVDADNIISFVDKWKNKVISAIVHCQAGVSRSAGVAAALCVIFNGEREDDWVFKNKKYSPNIRCYRTVLNQFRD